jgi:hypothetical protein
MVQRGSTVGPGLARGEGDIQFQRVDHLMRWVNDTALLNGWALRTAVVCLGLGVGTLPLPFIDVPAGPFGVVAGMLLAAWLVFEVTTWRRSNRGV